MKIAHVLTRFSPGEHPGGVERVVEELAKRQSEDHEVELICRNQFGDPEVEERDGFTILRAPCLNASGLRTLSSFYTMRKLIRESEADVYHIHDWSPFLNYRAAGMPGEHVLTLHNLSDNFFEGYAAKKAEKVSCVSEWLSNEIEARYKVETETVPNGVDVEKFENRESEGYALFVGSLIQGKGIREVCEVFEDRDRELKVVGTGPLIEELKQNYSHEFLGYVRDEELADIYSRCEYFVLPSRREGFGLVWIEALASGKPVITTDTGLGASLPEKFGEILSTDYTLVELKAAVKRIENKGFDAENLVEYAEGNFSWDNIVEDYSSIYADLK